MRSHSRRLRPALGLLLFTLILATCCIGASGATHAFGLFGFGRGGFARPIGRPMGPPIWRHPTPGFGGGYPGRPPGWGAPHPPIVGGGGVVGNGRGGNGGGNATNSRDNGNGNNGRGATPVAQSDQPFIADEVITAFAPDTTAQAIDQFARRYNLTQVETQNFPLIGVSLYRWRIGGGRSVPSIINALGNENIVASVQPNYIFTLQDQAATAGMQGDAAQYVLAELQIAQAHQLATGKDVLLAVIDSEIDAKHPDLNGTVVKSFDALGGGETAHLHGTEMAGAIAAHGKLLGVAPGAQILAAHAFDDTAGIAKGMSSTRSNSFSSAVC